MASHNSETTPRSRSGSGGTASAGGGAMTTRRDNLATAPARLRGRESDAWPQDSAMRLFEDPFAGMSAMLSGNPWQVMRRMQSEFDDMLSRAFEGGGMMSPMMGGGAMMGPSSVPTLWQPSLDVSETDDEYLIEAELPGVKAEDVDVEVRENVLRLSAHLREEREESSGGGEGDGAGQAGGGGGGNGRRYLRRERRWGSFERALALPEGVEQERIRCEFRDGVLLCHVPKSEPARQAARGRKIPIEGSDAGSSRSSAPGTAGA